MPEKTVTGFIIWAFWMVAYLLRPQPKTFDGYMLRAARTWWPWRKFRPNVFYNEVGRQWQIYLSDELSYTAMRTIRIPVHISDETGKIVGLNLRDGILDDGANTPMTSEDHPEHPIRPGDKLNCPRVESGSPNAGFSYENKPADDTCDYCGSLLGDDFMARIEAGDVILTPTDKPYKVYVTNSGGEPFMRSSRTDDGSSGLDQSKWVWETGENPMPKFYSQHLSEEQKQRFVELLNQKKLKFDYPGHFYKTPYFIEIKSGDST